MQVSGSLGGVWEGSILRSGAGCSGVRGVRSGVLVGIGVEGSVVGITSGSTGGAVTGDAVTL